MDKISMRVVVGNQEGDSPHTTLAGVVVRQHAHLRRKLHLQVRPVGALQENKKKNDTVETMKLVTRTDR